MPEGASSRDENLYDADIAEATDPLINEMGPYVLDKLSTFHWQNMQEYLVTADTDIDEFVR